MAICNWCKKEMNDAGTDTCITNQVVEFPDGSELPSIKFTSPPKLSPDEWMIQWRKARDEYQRYRKFLSGTDSDSEEAARKRCDAYQISWNRCHDCNVLSGGNHHFGCATERCPRCQDQLISCGCLDGKVITC